MKKRIAGILAGAALFFAFSPVAFAQTSDTAASAAASVTASAADTSVPTLAGITPSTGTTLAGSFKITAQGVEDPSGVQSVTFKVYNQTAGEAGGVSYIGTDDGTGNWSVVVNPKDLGAGDGTYVIEVIAQDDANNKGVIGTSSIDISSDQSMPTLSSITPTSGTSVSPEDKNFTVQATVSDTAGVKAVSFTVYNQADGAASGVSLGAADEGGGNWSQQISLSSLGNKAGTYTVEVWAADNLGNVGQIGSTQVVVLDVATATVQAAQASLQASQQSSVEKFISAAMAQLGKPYVLGGKGPDTFDCSGLVYYALKTSGTQINYMTSAEWAMSSYHIVTSMSDLQRGDVICFKGHVGIYLGNGMMLNASSKNGDVMIYTDILNSSSWQSSFICGRRVF